MKAMDFLTWIINQGVCNEGMGFASVCEGFDFEGFCGYQPEQEVSDGEYVYVYGDMVYDMDLELLWKSTGYTPYRIPTNEDDRRNGGKTVIYLIKLED